MAKEDDMGQEGTQDLSSMPGIRKGEEVEAQEGQEPGRKDTGTQYQSQRPKGTSDARDFTTVDPQDPQTEGTVKG
jgi:hypothetical protein